MGGRSFISMVEAADPRLRVYATQFHPEKNLFMGAGGLWRAAAGHPALPRRRRHLAVLCQLLRRRVPRLRPPLRLADGPMEAAHLPLSTVAGPADFVLAQLCRVLRLWRESQPNVTRNGPLGHAPLTCVVNVNACVN